MDSYNKLVVATRNYQAQSVKGGLGTGGRLVRVYAGLEGASGQVTEAAPPTGVGPGRRARGAPCPGSAPFRQAFSMTCRTFLASADGVYGFPMKETPSSRTP